MLISGIKKTTLLDYPDKIACIIFTAGCNLRCNYCYNKQFVLPEKISKIKDFIKENIFFNFLSSRIGIIEGVVICGGEPTIQKDLFEFCKKIKDLGFLVKLDTNGSNPKVLRKLLKNNLVDYIAMDIKGDFDNLEKIVGIKVQKKDYLESIKTILNSHIDYEFRTTLIKNYHFKENFKDLVKLIKGAKNYFLQNYQPGNTLIKSFDGKSFSLEEIKGFKKIAQKYVNECQIRF